MNIIETLIQEIKNGASLYIFEIEDDYIYHSEIYPTEGEEYEYMLNKYIGFKRQDLLEYKNKVDIFNELKMYCNELNTDSELNFCLNDDMDKMIFNNIRTATDFNLAFDDFLNSNLTHVVYIHN